MQAIWNENNIILHGTVAKGPESSHTSHGEQYYVFTLKVIRLSGAEDDINVVLSQRQLDQTPLEQGTAVTVRGEVRSFNNKNTEGSRLVITVYAKELLLEEEVDENKLSLSGTLCKAPVHRRTPLGRDICDMMLAVNRKYGRTDYLPCISWGALAQRCGELTVGQRVKLAGRLQSRVYTKRLGETSQERTAFEVSVMELEIETAATP